MTSQTFNTERISRFEREERAKFYIGGDGKYNPILSEKRRRALKSKANMARFVEGILPSASLMVKEYRKLFK